MSEYALELMLHKQFPTQIDASREIINLKAILSLPKPTEHFLSDLHGEYNAFHHMLRNGSGIIKDKIEQEFRHSLSPAQKNQLAICICYPNETINDVQSHNTEMTSWYLETIQRLIRICRVVSRKYTRSKVRKALPQEHQYIIEELLHETDHGGNKEAYYTSIIESIIEIGIAEQFIVQLCNAIHRLSIDALHIVGDIYDRGPDPHRIMDELIQLHAVDIQWGNHDIVWMGAACGSLVCIANVIRICARYGHINILEEGYGINLRPLASLASTVYKDDPSDCFPALSHEPLALSEEMLLRRMHKAIAIIQFKLEGQLVHRNPAYQMEHRLLLDKITDDHCQVHIDGTMHDLLDQHFPTLNAQDPYKLSSEEEALMDKLRLSFVHNEKLGSHVDFLFKKGSLYLRYNDNLLLHGCIPMIDDGSFASFALNGQERSGKALLDAFEHALRRSHHHKINPDNNTDVFWYLWCGAESPLFGKQEMKTFERYFIADKVTHKEALNPYYQYWEDPEKCEQILYDFNLKSDFSHIINGHIPVRAIDGERPIKADGKLLVIDGGLNPIYNPVTGTAGYTLLFDSYGLVLAAHESFVSKDQIIQQGKDIVTYFSPCDQLEERIRVRDTDIGYRIQLEIDSLQRLLDAYQQGIIKEQ